MKEITKNSIFLILIETFVVVFLFVAIGILTTDDNMNDLSFNQKLMTLFSFIVMFSIYGLIAKFIMEFFPKILIQKLFVKRNFNQLNMSKLWFYFILYGIVISLIWWSQAEFKLKINLNTSVAVFNLFAISISPFILKMLGWDIIEKVMLETKKGY